MQPWKYGTIPGQKEVILNPKRVKKLKLPELLSEPTEEKVAFVASGFDIPDPYEARLQFAKEGMYKPGPFEDAKPHDFRGVRITHEEKK